VGDSVPDEEWAEVVVLLFGPAGEPDPRAQCSAADAERFALTALAKLSEAYREVVRLRVFEDMNETEIMRALGIRKGTYRSRWDSGKRQLRRAVMELRT